MCGCVLTIVIGIRSIGFVGPGKINQDKTKIEPFLVRFLLGWLVGIEPTITGPQPAVLPLHHSHHGIERGKRIAGFAVFCKGRGKKKKAPKTELEKKDRNPLFTSLRPEAEVEVRACGRRQGNARGTCLLQRA